ncbi:MAG: DUF1178 family protein [Rhodospirillaceae bacterium]|jgi:hypothetical protein|nr:DUF1178 family protein [Rhodospirillaceae bacterium]MBT5455480.1 DUF1178 family protein [Rhodospirillaceae bacterium]
MIVFDLKCQNDHEFESWFQNTEAFEKLAKAKQVACPICGDTMVSKALMAPAVSGSKKKNDEKMAVSSNAAQQMGQYMAAVKELREQVEKNCDYVGDKFPEEARKIHYGETESRNIYGEASDTDAEELNEEGIEFQRVPWTPSSDA